MNGTDGVKSLGTWTHTQCPFAIAYVPRVLEEIRMAVVGAFRALPHGGLEIGGILLGSYTGDRVTITDSRPFACEHAFGPSFRLSADDHDRLAAVIAEAQNEGQTVVGWFHSHTRSEIFLTEADLEIHNTYFEEPFQVALVLKPIQMKPTLCGVFFREADGAIHSEESYREFELEVLAAEDARERVGTAESTGHAAEVQGAPQRRRRLREREEAEIPQTAQEPAPVLSWPVLPEADEQAYRQVARAWADAQASEPDEGPWTMAPPPRSGKRASDWTSAGLAVGVTVLLLGVAYVMLFGPWKPGAQPPREQAASNQTLGLKIARQGTDVVLTWDGNALATLGATAGFLSVKDGETRKETDLNVEQLRSANVLLSPESDRLEIQLTVLLPDHRTASESGIVMLPAPKSVEPAALTPTVPAKTYTASQIVPASQKIKVSKPPEAPPGRSRGADAPLPDQPSALRAGAPVEQIQASAPVALRTAPLSPPAMQIAEPERRESPTPRTAQAAPAPVPATQPQATSTGQAGPSAPARASEAVQPAVLILKKDPVYPYLARMGNVHGSVVLEGVIGTDGRVKTLTVVTGLLVLRQAALDAVSRWVYKPAMLNGKPVEARIRVEVRFREVT